MKVPNPNTPRTYKPTKSELATIRKGEAAIARGESVSLGEFLNGLAGKRRKAGTKATNKNQGSGRRPKAVRPRKWYT